MTLTATLLLGYNKSNWEAVAWEEIIYKHSLSIHNNRSKTFENRRGTSIIDWTLTTQNIANQVEEWRVDNDLELLSDHKPIRFCINFKPRLKEPKMKLLWNNANWDAIERAIKNELTISNSSTDVNKEANRISAFLKSTVTKWVPTIEIKDKRNNWWTEALEKEKSKLKRLKRSRTATYAEIFRAKKLYEHHIKKAKDKAWESFVNNTKNEDEFFKLTKLISRKNHTVDSMLDKGDGTATNDSEEKANLLMDSLTKPLVLNPRQKLLESKVNEELMKENNGVQEISIEEIKTAINDLKVSKAPGPDYIVPLFYKKTMTCIAKPLQDLFNMCLKASTFPEVLKEGRVIFLKKPGKKGDQMNHYRPITLTNVMAKLLEKILLKRLSETNDLISPRQFGYTKEISAEDAALKLTHIIQNDLKQTKENLTVQGDH